MREEYSPAAGTLPGLIERYETDSEALLRSYPHPAMPTCRSRMQAFQAEWLGRLEAVDYEALNPDARVDYHLLRGHAGHQARLLQIQEARFKEMAPLIPFAGGIWEMAEDLRLMRRPAGPATAERLHAMAAQIAALRQCAPPGTPPPLANRAATAVEDLAGLLERWAAFHLGYDPVLTWWVESPVRALSDALQCYAGSLRERFCGAGGAEEVIIGKPLGRDALLAEMQHELLAYTPEELIEIGAAEYAWCEREMRRAAAEMGHGDDWHAALEAVKELHVPPGEQPWVVRDMAVEAEEYVDAHDLVTVPDLCREMWRMRMMPPDRQRVNPFFLGGEEIWVSYATQSMAHDQKRMSMRGNNVHFARSTVFHELIPGHHLQGFIAARNRPYRRLFNTPFYVEGWALYWELLFWEMGFPRTPEERIGMLFWRMHRCARIIFSLRFHLGDMSAAECVEMLVERVGHERETALAEVRRSLGDEYPPLYQCAYMLGALQMWALRRELVESGAMPAKAFHDAVLAQNSIPWELLRAGLTQTPLPRDFAPVWRFYPA